MSRIPPPPPGFVIQQPAASSPPPPPPGFVVEGQAPQPEAPQEKIDWSQPPTVSDFGRSAGVLARDVLEGGGGLFGIVVDPLAQGLGMITGTPSESLRGSASRLADFAGLPKPQNSVERTISGIQQALVGGGGTLGIARGLAGSAAPVTAAVGRQLGESAGTQLVGAATGAGASGIVREEGGGAGAQAAAGLLGALAPTAGPAIAAEGVRRLARGGEAGRQQMAAAVDDFAKAGTTPTLGQAAPGYGARLSEAIIRQSPGGSGVMARRLEDQASEIGRRVDELAAQLSPASGAEKGGKAIVRGITGPGGFMERFRSRSGELYDEVQRLLPEDSTVQATNSTAALSRVIAPVRGAERTSAILQNPKIANIASAFQDDLAANGGTISYDSLKRLRTQVGELVDDSILVPDAGTRQLRQLYRAMSDDLTSAAKGTGDQRVINAVNRANNFHREGIKRIEEIEGIVEKSGGPEAVYRAMFSNSKEGGTTLRRVMQSLNGQQQKDFAAATLRRLGRSRPSSQGLSDDLEEVFNTETFLTNWKTMSAEARNALFDRFGSSYRKDLDTLAAAAERARAVNQTMPNTSNTTTLLAQGSAWGALGLSTLTGNLGTAALIGGGMAGTNVMARAFTNPRLVRWMAQQTQAPAQAVPAAINQLAQIAKEDEDAAELLRQIEANQAQLNSR